MTDRYLFFWIWTKLTVSQQKPFIVFPGLCTTATTSSSNSKSNSHYVLHLAADLKKNKQKAQLFCFEELLTRRSRAPWQPARARPSARGSRTCRRGPRRPWSTACARGWRGAAAPPPSCTWPSGASSSLRHRQRHVSEGAHHSTSTWAGPLRPRGELPTPYIHGIRISGSLFE